MEPLLFPDSLSYLGWPSDYVLPGGIRVMGARPPVYPLFLTIFGGATLVYAQTTASILGWAFLGWAVAGTAGVLAAGALALTPTVWTWNTIVLSESLSLSLTAALMGASVQLARGWSVRRGLAWSLLVVAVGWTRDVNLYLLPFLAFPLAFVGWRRAAWLMGIVVAVMVFGMASLIAEDRWQYVYGDVITARILPDREARSFFARAGMPVGPAVREQAGQLGSVSKRALREKAPEFLAWLDEHGMATYQRWLLLRPASYVEAWTQLEEHLHVVPPTLGVQRPAAVRAASVVYDWVVAPKWWCLIALFPLAEWLVRRRIGPLSGLAGSLVAGTYVQAFIGYHGDAEGVGRHLLAALVLYRVTQWVGVAAAVAIAVSAAGQVRQRDKR
ncbi:MAG: hypothetical protein ACYSVY_17475 [Planctomycetota bacterium]|jgi:hypothetical protein